jgi:hypothetical protein
MKNLQKFLDKENAWAKLFSKSNAPKYEIDTAEGRQKVADSIDSQLSPENLTCDGELSVSEIRIRYKYLTAAAADLRKLDPSVKFWEYSDEAY